ncbi:MAG: class I SAM-dependent methyltransferase, partial [Candidatus Woesearchaeota archaeon]|nr:class I SAM-dependent methyltransferase [Candidatus Woesearchaeota archaeon]
MKYGKGYSFITRTTGFLARTLLYFRKTELSHMLDVLEENPPTRILDYGCNSGYFCNMLKNRFPDAHVCGADINVSAIRYATKKYKKTKFHFITDEFFEKFKKQKFDVIILSHVLEHMREPKKTLELISKILHKDGKILLAVPQERIKGDATPIQLIYNYIRGSF